MHRTETVELLCADAWPAVTEDKVGDWRLRAASGFTGRANSALAVGDPGLPVAEALDRVCEFAHAHDIPPVAQAVVGSANERAIEAAGWVPKTDHAAGHLVSVLVGPLGTGADGVSFLPEPSAAWWELAAGTTEPAPAQRHVLTTGEVGYAVAEITAGAVRAAVAGGLLHVSRLAVRPQHRRRGLARALMAATGEWAAGRGATECVLQVAVDNAPALALYEALGFREHHQYRYWVPACEDRSL
ncbi:GNAT family N-acetyltransferase [Amycolatopsis acidiphila]|uniref:GNAT family N-acetyltransferase n=1 Tax=Amycolatopsis acidiphila TaxID=715473 RepID=A0A558A0F0_9PSEU|nr:GNAT family N-acetyltransferase [Amycolatopsis acidiphila]TVT17739.1 GNAT family N-acetyltransferase [Amycolatopsis acidiphila]UIJ60932.1 GNAT family N-acetyltransferase [Amycolatopsis acidiphila]